MTIEWSQDERRVFSLCSFVSSLLSLIGSIFIFISFLAFFKSRWKQITHRLVLSLSLCHLLLSVCWLIGGPLDEVSAVTCQVLAPLRYYLFLASFLWTSVIATEMLSMWYRARVNQFGELVIPQPSSVRQELCYHIAAWGIPLAITIWPTIFHHQEHGLWQCWFEDDYWTFLFLGFVALSCLYCLGVYCLALFKYRTRLYDAGTVKMTKVGSDLLSGCVPQFTAEHEVWMGAFFADKSVGDEPWLLTGAQLAPGFDPADSTLANRTDFIDRFPAWYHDLIIKLTPGQ
ncbi:uncharacterized protein ACA1_153000 [Acanthamoeba castellanii str. Neff]|uniref:G-protein coupled receptors family 2 profile 2 domain-containing protein n=1 Tax=Acanthamoeba castellanii (strain ATCC 30010 / Neff) TaxID=1257118 RepID=L8HIA6_ACACF|nr:uncharacterized protein ACA1_153000 [Acanthamoeba castellanii str. Neff]ELR24101.1 hypothetical protein ACA1_153000 [Acanthamoeba castellanii str. Neff]